ncbi:MAG: methyl-accepting chemotaxis protein [Deltaproteobacteria bacterium]|jgi:hypothetical protein|nr:methyl-accepting chemotaxis protein [Deltaproteobacteria bacterium]
MRLSNKILVVCLLAGVLPGVIITLAANYYSSQMYVDVIYKSLNGYRNAIDTVLVMHKEKIDEETKQILLDLERLEKLDADANQEFQQVLNDTVANSSDIDYVAVFDSSDKIVWSTQDPNALHKVAFENLRDVPMAPGNMELTVPGAIDMRTAVPVLIAGSPAGKLVTGKFLFNDWFISALKDALAVDFSVIVGDTRYATTLKDNSGQSLVGTKETNPLVLSEVLTDGKSLTLDAEIGGQMFGTCYWPIQDHDKKIIGMYFIGEPTVKLEASQRHFVISVASILLAVLVLLFVAVKIVVSTINKSLTGIIAELQQSFEQVGSCSTTIKSTSDTISQGARDQADALQETAAALEEMMAMTKQSADNSNLTRESNSETNGHIKEGVRLTGSMMEAMGQIEASAKRIEAIIKTIDDIAFQTNLLALNAAVEAARAGEAGAGFAVVADEVRNLSLRSSEAARNTNELITTSVDRVSYGVKIVNDLDGCFKKIEKGAETVSTLIDEISVATTEQSHGAVQAEQSVESTSRVAERNAQEAAAASSASASLNAASASMEESIYHLGTIIGGRGIEMHKLIEYKK